MTETQRKTFGLWVAGPLLVALLTWGARKYDQSKLDTSRFVADSIRRALLDSSRQDVLLRVDSRVRDIYCSTIPTDRREGCR